MVRPSFEFGACLPISHVCYYVLYQFAIFGGQDGMETFSFFLWEVWVEGGKNAESRRHLAFFMELLYYARYLIAITGSSFEIRKFFGMQCLLSRPGPRHNLRKPCISIEVVPRPNSRPKLRDYLPTQRCWRGPSTEREAERPRFQRVNVEESFDSQFPIPLLIPFPGCPFSSFRKGPWNWKRQGKCSGSHPR
ncbi:hypothetical protein ACRALDRAFT_207784 [Sodiomyces alcalophilus JCM 7366]|uniref:uncharacterized protein n=1 Tax=Sodiomyces alcalophilus JCM 7366 TaxID=591952 RepID=UPI0039B5B10F